MTVETLAKLKLEADTATTTIGEFMKQLNDQLSSGIPLSVGKSIIKDIWGEGVDATKLIARLSSSFPDDNASMIRSARLPDSFVSAAYSFNEKSSVFMEYAFNYIKETIPKIVEILSGYAPDDVIGAEVAKGFRRESLRFMEAIRNGDFYSLQVEAMVKWGEFQTTYMSTGVEDGDYMFISDFLPEMEKIGQRAVATRERECEGGAKEWATLSNITFDANRELLTLKLTFMYCEYLETFLHIEE